MKLPKVKLILFVISGSLHCKEAEKLLKEAGIKFELKNVDNVLSDFTLYPLPLLVSRIENSMFASGLASIKKVIKEK